MAKSKSDELVERIERLLDVVIAAARNDGDEEAALLALQEASKAADRLSKERAVTTMNCGRTSDAEDCGFCGAGGRTETRDAEECPLASPSTNELLDRQLAVTAAATGFCNPTDGACESCQ